ncbi:MAG TPA: hypothetical protein VL651_08460, partial [Bacteroidia bacterium]|nr:hypothetical protein [Bacteroidia bacterium]
MIGRFRKFLFITAVFAGNFIHAQDHIADSLNALLKNAKEDTNHVNLLLSLADHYKATDEKKCFDYAVEGTTLAKKLNFTRGIYRGYQFQGFAYQLHGDLPNALKYFTEGVKYAGNDMYSIGVAALYTRIGYADLNTGKTSDGIAAFLTAERIVDSLKVCGMGSDVYRGSGSAYSSIGEYTIATSKFIRSLDYAEQCGDQEDIGYGYVYLGNNHEAQKDYDHALDDFRKSLSCFVKAK